MTWRYYAQRAVTNNWLDRDLELQSTQLTWTLTGPGSLQAVVDGETAAAVANDGRFLLDEWSTLIYAEENDQVRWGGIMNNSTDIGGGARSIQCVSFSGYPARRIFLGELSFWVTDAFNVVRELWNYVQSDPDGNLGVTLSTNLAHFTLGDADPGPMPTQNPGESDADYDARLTEWKNLVNTPFELAWWNTPNIGNEIDSIFSQSRTDYLERHEWTGGKEGVAHFIDLFAENRVNRRNDLRFVEGENLKVAPQPQRDGDAYFNFMKGLGAGDDRHTLAFEAYAQHDGRLRNDGVYPAKNLLVPDVLAQETTNALNKASNVLKFDTIEVVDHPNARIGSWQLGDEILVQTYSGFEKLNEWMRIAEWTLSPDVPDAASIKLVKPDA